MERRKAEAEPLGEPLGDGEVSVTVPSLTDVSDATAVPKDGETVDDNDDERQLLEVVTRLSVEEGSSGATTLSAVGFWSSSGGGEKLTRENVTLVKVSSSLNPRAAA